MRNFFLSYFRQKVNYHSSGYKIFAQGALFLSSQCVTLGSRNFDNWILWSSPLLYERCTFEGKSTKNGVIQYSLPCHPSA
ncbi:MAG: hypothetical protein ACEY3F_04290 [Wolbachia sp.]